jgi:hypothetical protein
VLLDHRFSPVLNGTILSYTGTISKETGSVFLCQETEILRFFPETRRDKYGDVISKIYKSREWRLRCSRLTKVWSFSFSASKTPKRSSGSIQRTSAVEPYHGQESSSLEWRIQGAMMSAPDRSDQPAARPAEAATRNQQQTLAHHPLSGCPQGRPASRMIHRLDKFAGVPPPVWAMSEPLPKS